MKSDAQKTPLRKNRNSAIFRCLFVFSGFLACNRRTLGTALAHIIFPAGPKFPFCYGNRTIPCSCVTNVLLQWHINRTLSFPTPSTFLALSICSGRLCLSLSLFLILTGDLFVAVGKWMA